MSSCHIHTLYRGQEDKPLIVWLISRVLAELRIVLISLPDGLLPSPLTRRGWVSLTVKALDFLALTAGPCRQQAARLLAQIGMEIMKRTVRHLTLQGCSAAVSGAVLCCTTAYTHCYHCTAYTRSNPMWKLTRKYPEQIYIIMFSILCNLTVTFSFYWISRCQAFVYQQVRSESKVKTVRETLHDSITRPSLSYLNFNFQRVI